MAERSSILIVDDTEANVDILVDILGDLYDVSVAMDGPTALDLALQESPDLVLLDVMMPGMDGFEVCRRLKENKLVSDTPVVFVTAMDETEDEQRGLELGAVDYLIKPVNPAITLARVKTHLTLKLAKDFLQQQNEILEKRVRERTKELQLTQDVTIHGLASLAETRDNETGLHIRRTQQYVRHLAETLRANGHWPELLTEAYINLLFKSAPLHDIGKVGVPDAILLKPGKLTDDEYELMKKHAEYGHEALERAEQALGTDDVEISFLEAAKEIALSHHEKWDGSGYPYGHKGEGIPLSGRIMAVADVYDALISKRVYKPGFSHQKAVEIIVSDSGTAFDPAIADCFSNTEKEILEIAFSMADGEEQRATLKS